MKLFYFIMVHKLPEQVGELARALSGKGDHLCIHVDRKVDREPFLRAIAGTDALLLANRRRVNWGGFSQVACILDGMKRFADSGCDYFILLSGQDFPIKPIKVLRQHLVQHAGHCFMDIRKAEDNWGHELRRLRVHYFVDFWSALKQRLPAGSFVINKIEGLVNKCQYLVVKRNFKHGILYGGSSWFALPSADADLVLKAARVQGKFVRFFRTCISPDEMFFHTLLGNHHGPSHFKPSFTFSLFKNGNRNPEVLLSSDLEMLQRRPEFFARKFDVSLDEKILTEVQKLDD